ncbi:5-oxoprolinase subunit PxpB [Virgibacillus byunsanensis]|uniref:5-oxoprolinase subunit PxpB n=1 Tax=Virgibacillus byunsanensis TaxID=570945 RepID=A0ABW3LF74_9BACI
MDFSIQAVGDSALRVQFLENVSPELNRTITDFCKKLETFSDRGGIVEWVPAFDSVTIYYRPHVLLYREMYEKVLDLIAASGKETATKSRVVHVPVVYGGNYGPDLQQVADYHQLTIEEVIAIHQQPEYLIYMIGFLPGFPYLGGLDKKIATPRLENPRPSIFAGAVGIAAEQTGIYPVESPGGWNIIGKTPLKLFDVEREEEPFLFQSGNYVKFYEVSEHEFTEIEKQVESQSYSIQISTE